MLEETTTHHRVPGPLKWHGGKTRLAPRIIGLMPDHLHYVEPYGGGLAVLLAKPFVGTSEVVNDIDGDLMAFWQVMRDEALFARFRRMVEATPFAEAEWEEASRALREQAEIDPVERALYFFIACRQSLAGRRDVFAPLSRRRTRRGMNEQASAWLSATDGLPEVHARMRRVVVLNRPALDVIKQQDGPGTLFYLDPPYLPSARSAPDVFRFEMSENDHRILLGVLQEVRGKVMVSGYPSDMYDAALAGWTRHIFDVPRDAAGGRAKERGIEVLWCNF